MTRRRAAALISGLALLFALAGGGLIIVRRDSPDSDRVSMQAARKAFARVGIQLDLEYGPSGIKKIGSTADKLLIAWRPLPSQHPGADIPNCAISLEAPLENALRVTLCPDDEEAEKLVAFVGKRRFIEAVFRHRTLVAMIYDGSPPNLRARVETALALLPR